MALNLELPVKVSGRFRCDVLSSETGELQRSSYWFENLILDTGLDRMRVGGSGFSICRVGTGSSTPSPSNQALDNQIAFQGYTAQNIDNVNLDDGYAWTRMTYTFAEGAVVGNIAEVGVGWANATSGTLFSRALIKDQFGNPTTITVLADEILVVTWEIRRYWPTGDFSGVITNVGNHGGDFSWTARAANVASWTAGDNAQCGFFFSAIGAGAIQTNLRFLTSELGPITGEPSGSISGSGSISTLTAPVGSNRTTVRLSFSLAQANSRLETIRLATSYSGRSVLTTAWQFKFTPGITKTSDDTLQIDLSISWARRS